MSDNVGLCEKLAQIYKRTKNKRIKNKIYYRLVKLNYSEPFGTDYAKIARYLFRNKFNKHLFK